MKAKEPKQLKLHTVKSQYSLINLLVPVAKDWEKLFLRSLLTRGDKYGLTSIELKALDSIAHRHRTRVEQYHTCNDRCKAYRIPRVFKEQFQTEVLFDPKKHSGGMVSWGEGTEVRLTV